MKALVFLLTVLVSSFSQAEIYIVANAAVDLDRIDQKQLRDVYMGRSLRDHDGERVNAMVRGGALELSDDFLASALSTTPEKYERYWAQRVFSGKGMALGVISERQTNTVLNSIANMNEESLTYVSADSLQQLQAYPNIKVLMVLAD